MVIDLVHDPAAHAVMLVLARAGAHSLLLLKPRALHLELHHILVVLLAVEQRVTFAHLIRV